MSGQKKSGTSRWRSPEWWIQVGVLASCVAIVGLMVVALAVSCAQGAEIRAVDPVCRVRAAGGSTGTGCVFEVSQGSVFVLTCAHVVQGAESVSCSFWSAGHESAPVAGRVALRAQSVDAAILALPESAFGGMPPLALPWAPRDYVLRAGDTICSAGCASGAWVTFWRGHATGYAQDNRLTFQPPPSNGRSGAPITDATGTQIVGIIQARAQDGQPDAHGIAVPIQHIYGAFDRVIQTQYGVQDCDPRNCDPRMCPRPGPQGDGRFRLLPERKPEAPKGGNLWPTLPAPVPTPTPPPQADLKPIEEKLDLLPAQIADALRPLVAPPLPSVPAEPQTDPAVTKALAENQAAIKAQAEALKDARTEIGALRAEIPRAVAEGIRPVAEAVAPLLRIKDKLESDADEGGLKGKLAQKILDRWEKDQQKSSEVKVERDQTPLMIGLGLVALAGLLAIFSIVHLARTGKSYAGEVTERLVERHPDNERLAALAAKVEARDAALTERLRLGEAKAKVDAEIAALRARFNVAAAPENAPAEAVSPAQAA